MKLELPRLVPRRVGCVLSTSGCVAHVGSLNAKVGDVCTLTEPDGRARRGEVIALQAAAALVWVDDGVQGLSQTTRVEVVPQQALLGVGPGLLGRVIDPYGTPLDGGPAINVSQRLAIAQPSPPAMRRRRVNQTFTTGVRSIDGLCTLAVGQRIGIMAPAGVGKTTLLGMMARFCSSEINVIALIGERGREVREFVEDALGEEGLRRSVVVCSTSDRSPIERFRAALAATTIAEYFRDRGQQVLLMVDSLTRFARAQRELGLAQGEMPTRRGYPASLFASLPALVERAGPGPQSSGADITAVYTVLMEDAQTNDPVAEEVKSLLDGHLHLCRSIAASGQYPAIDIRNSISRLMDTVATKDDKQRASQVRAAIEKYAEVSPLALMGEYHPGEDALADRAMQLHEPLRGWLTQKTTEASDLQATRSSLADLLQ
jgi:ATP synthase in type III secretion protein N